jgi:hypothetical protein
MPTDRAGEVLRSSLTALMLNRSLVESSSALPLHEAPPHGQMPASSDLTTQTKTCAPMRRPFAARR